ncbi:MAG: sugar phosphate isomerase/epimerase [Alphaproteobacteria bacterium]|nr:sugar phosphate isomerase/epimerase [Alphaproteobacteria bacterium]
MPDLKRLSIHQATVMQQWNLRQAIEGTARAGLSGFSVWRDKLTELGTTEAAKVLDGAGVAATGLSFAGLITSADKAEAAKALDEARRVFDEAAAIKAPSVVFVAGGVDPRDKDIKAARARAVEGLAKLVPHARAVGVKIALEPLHPMICAHRSVLSTIKLANEWCDAVAAEDVVGIAVDTYALWWDPELEQGIQRAGKRILAFHLSDWLVDTQDLRLDRGMMGDGVIDLKGFRRMVERAGYAGWDEVEIFSARNWWNRDPDEVVRVVKERYGTAT